MAPVGKTNTSALTYLVETAVEVTQDIAAAAATVAARLVEPGLAPRTNDSAAPKADLAPAPAADASNLLALKDAQLVTGIAVLDLDSTLVKAAVTATLAKRTVEVVA